MTTRTARLKSAIVSPRRIDPASLDAMWNLFERYYESVTREAFEQDLRAKDAVILLRDARDGSLQGFSTIQVMERRLEGEPFVAIFSGDTIVDARYWGQPALHRAFLRFIAFEKLRRPGTPVYWFLISKGYKTYLLLARNFAEFWPRSTAKTPGREMQILDLLAREKFGEAWRPDLGVLRFPTCPGRLKTVVAPLDDALLADPDVRLFAEKNPGHRAGDELCCLGKIDARLCLAALKKFVLASPRTARAA